MANRISIKADREYLRELFDKLEKKNYSVPVFQRDFVWKPQQIINLFDSILRGYPIGSLVLWKSADVHQSKHILTDEIIDAPDPDYFILDGRQRVTTLYGVLLNSKDKNIRFNLLFNLEKQSFEFSQKESPFLVSVATLYDTFSMLDWMRTLPERVKNEEKLHSYIYNAKNLNSILQEYIVSEILIGQCGFSEAGEVFSRINSTGTKIEALDMLQALKFGGDNSMLISSYIQKIQNKLQKYDFQDITPKDILNCCFWYTDKKYYDSRIENLEKEDLESIFPKVMVAIDLALSFLRNYCGVLSSKLLPYSKQLLALVWVFKDGDVRDSKRLKELRRWFFYTTYTQTFMNGALQHIRSVHNRLEVFILGQSSTAFDYEPLSLPSFSLRFSSRSAQARFLALSIIGSLLDMGVSSEEISFLGFEHLYNGNSLLSYEPRIVVEGKKISMGDWKSEELSLSPSCKKLIIEKRKEAFERLEKGFLESLGLEFEEDETA